MALGRGTRLEPSCDKVTAYHQDVEATRTVRGEIVLPASGGLTTSADVIVQVEDVSRADAPSIVVGEQRQREVSLHEGGVLPFAVEIPARLIDERRTYSVRVHIDISRSGNVRVGDLVSTQTYPVLTRGHGTEARITVRPVK